MEIKNIFAEGGPIMVPLLISCVIAIALIVERSRFWYRIYRRQPKFVRNVLNLYRHNDVVSTIEVLKQNIDLPVARIFLAGFELGKPTPENFRLALESEAQSEIRLLKRFNGVLETIVGLAPLLGLLGTIIGLISTFAGVNLGDVGGTKTTQVTGGISEALIATATGMVVAIIALIATNLFRGFFEDQLSEIQEYGGQLELLYRTHYDQGE